MKQRNIKFKKVKLPCPFCGKSVSIRILLEDGLQKKPILSCPHCWYRINLIALRWELKISGGVNVNMLLDINRFGCTNSLGWNLFSRFSQVEK